MLGNFNRVLHFFALRHMSPDCNPRFHFTSPYLIFNFQPYMSKVDVRYNA